MPILSVFFGIIVRMWHDDHPPPHIHVEYQGFEALVDVRTGEVRQGRLPGRAATMAEGQVFHLLIACPLRRRLKRHDRLRAEGQVFHLLIACPLRRRLKRHDRRRRRAAVVSGAARWRIGHRYPEHATPASK
ncbi:MAG: DUF4160 domain-containing protein [Thauera sp.]